MKLPQIIYISVLMLGLGLHIAKHGEPRDQDYNAFIALISIVLQLGLLWWGGFFNG